MRRPSSAGLSIIVAAVLCALAIVAAVYSAMWVFKDPGAVPTKKWFYDLNTNQLFVGPGHVEPPIDAPSGDREGGKAGEQAGVGAVVLTINGEEKIAYLYTYDAKDKEKLEAELSGDSESMGSYLIERWVRLPAEDKWHKEMSEAGSKIVDESMANLPEGASFSFPE
jgi:hypothetical protein